MTKRDYQAEERARVMNASNKNARPILRFTVVDGVYHVIGLTATGKTFHEKFATLDEATVFAKSINLTLGG